jgi:hypothetical protein
MSNAVLDCKDGEYSQDHRQYFSRAAIQADMNTVKRIIV